MPWLEGSASWQRRIDPFGALVQGCAGFPNISGRWRLPSFTLCAGPPRFIQAAYGRPKEKKKKKPFSHQSSYNPEGPPLAVNWDSFQKKKKIIIIFFERKYLLITGHLLLVLCPCFAMFCFSSLSTLCRVSGRALAGGWSRLMPPNQGYQHGQRVGAA